MKRTISTLLLILSGHLIHAQISDSTKMSQVNAVDSIDLNDTTIYAAVDTVASFPGGKDAWNNYVGKTLDASVGFENGAKFGKYKVMINFVVMKDGTLTDFRPETKFGHGLEDEVIRVLKLSPKWHPAKKNNLKVISRVTQTQLIVLEKG